MIDVEYLLCELDCCRLILEKPVTLPCGNTLCEEHLKNCQRTFTCCFCNREHQKPDNGFFISKTVTRMIDNYYNLNPLRRKVKESFEELNESMDDYENIDPDVYIYDYFAKARNKVDLHREELIKEISEISEEIIERLKEREEKCKANLTKVEKTNFDELTRDNLQCLKQKFRFCN